MIFVAHTGFFCAHVVGSVTVVELSLVTLIRPESEPLEGVLETEDASESLTDDFVVECALAVRDGLLDGFNGLDVGFLPDECSAKEQCIVEMWFMCTTIGGWLGGHARESCIQTPVPNRSSLVAACSTCALIYKLSRPL